MAKTNPLNVTVRNADDVARAAAQMVTAGLGDIDAWYWLQEVTAGAADARRKAQRTFLRALTAPSAALIDEVAQTKGVSMCWLLETERHNGFGNYRYDPDKITDPKLLAKIAHTNDGIYALLESGAAQRLEPETWEEWVRSEPSAYQASLALDTGYIPTDIAVKLISYRDDNGEPLGDPKDKFHHGWFRDEHASAAIRVFIEADDDQLKTLYGSASYLILGALYYKVGFPNAEVACAFLDCLAESLEVCGADAFVRFRRGDHLLKQVASDLEGDTAVWVPTVSDRPWETGPALERLAQLCGDPDAAETLVARRPVDPLLALLRARRHRQDTAEYAEQPRQKRTPKAILKAALKACRDDEEKLLILDAAAPKITSATLRSLGDLLPDFYVVGKMPLVDALVAFGGEAVIAWAERRGLPYETMLTLAGRHPGLTLDDLSDLLEPV